MMESSAEVEQEAPAQANNSDVSTSTPRSIRENGDKSKTHGFSKTVAEIRRPNGEKVGWNAAIVLRYLAIKVRDHGKKNDGKKWVRVNLDWICSQYPYLGRSTVDECVQRLVEIGACEAKNMNSYFGRPKYDRTRSYHVPVKWMNAAEEEIRYFDSALATEIGVPAATIYRNFMHWIEECREKEQPEHVQLAPAVIETLQPFDKSTIKRAIATLKTKGMIVPVGGKQCWYVKGPVDWPGSKADETGSNPDKGSSKADESGSNPDNDIYCSYVIDVLEESSKNEPSVLSCSSPVKKQMNESGVGHDPSARHDDDGHDRDEHQQDICWPFIRDHDELRTINRVNNALVLKIEQNRQSTDQLLNIVYSIVSKFFEQYDITWVDELYDEATDEELFEQLLPKYRAYFSQTKVARTNGLFDVLYFGAFECILGAFLRSRHEHKKSHPITLFIRIAYDFHLVLWDRAEQRRLKAIDEEFDQRRREYASPDEHLEDRVNLSPAEKTRVFKQGLYSRNKVGAVHFDQQLRTDEIKISTGALKRIEKIFAANSKAAPADLLEVMDGCLHLHRTMPTPTRFRHGVKWHARMGHRLTTFARYLGPIIQQLEIIDSPFTTLQNESESDDLQSEPLAVSSPELDEFNADESILEMEVAA